jgi:hypothetical protein
MVIDVSDYGSMIFKGGDIPYFNARGFIIIFPENEGYIDPSTITDGFDATATEIEQQRKIFRNPRGLEYYYAFVKTDENPPWNTFDLFKSSDGVSWSDAWSNDVWEPDSIDLVIWNDTISNNRTLIYVAHTTFDLGIYVVCFTINDTTSDASILWSQPFIASETDDGVFYPNIELDDDGHLWVSWTDEYTSGGKQRNDVYVTGSNETYPISAPTWNTTLKVYNGIGTTKDPTQYIRSELTRITATGDMAVTYAVELDGGSMDVYGKILSRGDPPTAGAQVDITGIGNTVADLKSSSIAESESDSDVFVVIQHISTVWLVKEWDISAGSTTTYFQLGHNVGNKHESVCLSMRTNQDPDVLVVFGIQTDNYLWANSTPVDSLDYDSLFNVSEPGQYNFSSSFWDSDTELLVIYTNQSAPYNVRFLNYTFGPPIVYPGDPDHLFGAGFNGSLGFVLLNWNHTLESYTDFEIHNSSDGIVFVFLDNVTDPWYNHTNIANMTYQYYRVRARNFMDWYGEYFNSSWTDTNLERVYYELGDGGSISTTTIDAPFMILGLMIGLLLGIGLIKAGLSS